MFIDVTTTEQLEEVKKLIQIKKKPNRKPFPKENAIYSKCGQRCDLCVHYVGTTDEQRSIHSTRLNLRFFSWSHYAVLLQVSDEKARGWYEKSILQKVTLRKVFFPICRSS